MENNNNNNIGALWLSESTKGRKYMKGIITVNNEKIPIVIFKNTGKQEDKQPDYVILKRGGYNGR